MADGALPHLRASALALKLSLFLLMSRNRRYFLCSSGTSPCKSGRARAQTSPNQSLNSQELDSRPLQVGFVVNEVALRHFSSSIFVFYFHYRLGIDPH
jgi:hypothetical protein